jgi:hypothetical protein
MTMTATEGPAEHALSPDWDPANDDLNYGRHTAHCEDFDNVFGQLTVDDILQHRTAEEILKPYGPSRLNRAPRREGEVEGPSVSEILERLANEQEATQLLTPPEKDRALGRILREQIQVAPPFWDTHTPTGVLLKPHRPDQKGQPKHDPDATVGFMPVRIPERGEPGFRYDEPPLGHDTGAHPLDHTRLDEEAIAAAFAERDAKMAVKIARVGLLKQAINGWLPKKWWLK